MFKYLFNGAEGQTISRTSQIKLLLAL